MTPGSTDGAAPVKDAARLRKLKGAAKENFMKTLDALAVEFGKIAAERDFAVSAQDKSQAGGLSFPEGRIP